MSYKPNHIPQGERTTSIIFASIMFLYGTIGVLSDDIYIPGKHRPGTHFHGVPCIVLYGAFLMAATNLLTVVFDHYDTRNNERNYRLLAKGTKYLGWALFVLALFLDVAVYHQGTRAR